MKNPNFEIVFSLQLPGVCVRYGSSSVGLLYTGTSEIEREKEAVLTDKSIAKKKKHVRKIAKELMVSASQKFNAKGRISCKTMELLLPDEGKNYLTITLAVKKSDDISEEDFQKEFLEIKDFLRQELSNGASLPSVCGNLEGDLPGSVTTASVTDALPEYKRKQLTPHTVKIGDNFRHLGEDDTETVVSIQELVKNPDGSYQMSEETNTIIAPIPPQTSSTKETEEKRSIRRMECTVNCFPSQSSIELKAIDSNNTIVISQNARLQSLAILAKCFRCNISLEYECYEIFNRGASQEKDIQVLSYELTQPDILYDGIRGLASQKCLFEAENLENLLEELLLIGDSESGNDRKELA